MADTYEPYEPPAEPAREPQDDATAAPQHEWPLFTEPDPAPASTTQPVYVQNPHHRPAPARAANPLAAVIGGIAVLAIAVGSYSASQASGPGEADYRDQWQQCLAEEQNHGGLLEPEDLCSIQYPNGESDYGDLGYDNEDPGSFLDDSYDDYDDPDWYTE